MATIHVTEAEAAKDLPGLLAKARAGERVLIDGELGNCVLTVDSEPVLWSIDEAIRRAEALNSGVLLDGDFGKDMEEMYRQHESELLGDSWQE